MRCVSILVAPCAIYFTSLFFSDLYDGEYPQFEQIFGVRVRPFEYDGPWCSRGPFHLLFFPLTSNDVKDMCCYLHFDD